MKFTKHRNGLMMTNLRITLTLSEGDINALKDVAKSNGQSLRHLLTSAAYEGIQLEIEGWEESAPCGHIEELMEIKLS